MLIKAYGMYIQAMGIRISLQGTIEWVCQCISGVKCQLLSGYWVDMYGKYMEGLLH